MTDDFRFAFRQLRKNPGFAAIAIVTLALGIGAAAAMFGLIQGVLLSPPPYADPDRVVLVSPARSDGAPYRRGATIGQWTVVAAGAHRSSRRRSIAGPSTSSCCPTAASRWAAWSSRPSYFRVLGLRPILGREFVDAELAPAERATVGGDPRLRPLAAQVQRRSGHRRTHDPDEPHAGAGAGRRRDASGHPVPARPGRVERAQLRPERSRRFLVRRGPGRIAADHRAPGMRSRGCATVRRCTEAQTEITALSGGLGTGRPALQGITAAVVPVQDVLNRDGRRLLVPLFGSVALVFFIACANVAGLLLTRGLQRHSEYAMRSALGADAMAAVPSGVDREPRPRVRRRRARRGPRHRHRPAAQGDRRTGGAACRCRPHRLAGASRSGFSPRSSPPASLECCPPPAPRCRTGCQGLKGTRTTAGRQERRLLGAVATLQIVLTVALLAGAALLVRTARNLDRMQPGYDTENILAMTVTTMERQKSNEFHQLALERVASVPGVTRAAFAWGVPLTGNKWTADVEFPGQAGSSKLADRITVPLRSITEDYFDVMGMRSPRAARFAHSDGPDAPRVAIVNATLREAVLRGPQPGRRPPARSPAAPTSRSRSSASSPTRAPKI